jgi:hypothetical protein
LSERCPRTWLSRQSKPCLLREKQIRGSLEDVGIGIGGRNSSARNVELAIMTVYDHRNGTTRVKRTLITSQWINNTCSTRLSPLMPLSLRRRPLKPEFTPSFLFINISVLFSYPNSHPSRVRHTDSQESCWPCLPVSPDIVENEVWCCCWTLWQDES